MLPAAVIGAVLALQLKGDSGGQEYSKGDGYRKTFLGHMFKHAVFVPEVRFPYTHAPMRPRSEGKPLTGVFPLSVPRSSKNRNSVTVTKLYCLMVTDA